MIHITEEEVRKNLHMGELISELETAFRDYGTGDAESSARNRIFTGTGFLNTMPAFWRRHDLSGLKAYLGSAAGARFVVLVFRESNMDDYFVLDADRLGQMRTGALPAMVTSKIPGLGKDPSFLLLGAGYQAETQLMGMKEAMGLTEAHVYSRTREKAESFSKKMEKELGIKIHVVDNLKNLSDFRVISTITTSKEPLITLENLPEKVHLNLCGANLKFRAETSPEAISKMDLVILEHQEQSMLESAEVEHVIGTEKAVELKDFIQDPVFHGKRSAFKTMGIGLEDLVAAYIVLRNMGHIRE